MSDSLTDVIAQALHETSEPIDYPNELAADIAARIRARGLALEPGNIMVCDACRSPLCFAGEFLCKTARAAGVSTALAVPSSQILAEGPTESGS